MTQTTQTAKKVLARHFRVENVEDEWAIVLAMQTYAAPLEDKIDELEAWKAEATAVFNDADLQSLARKLEVGLGEPIAVNLVPKVGALLDRVKELEGMLNQVVYEYEQAQQSFKTILEIKETLK